METISNYKILSLIGDGGMGSVYLGEHLKLGRKVAVKELHSELTANPQFKERFINEAKILAKLNHHNIVTLYDFIESNDKFYIIMEYIEGKTLDNLLEDDKQSFSQERVVKLFKQILSAFSYAHKQGIIHRDIKPSNVIVGTDDIIKILDFGIAKIISNEAKLTRPGTKIGSLYYMSPEQVLGKEIDLRSDIYSLGVLLFEMLSGKMPYTITTETDYEIMEKIVKEQIPSIRNINPEISPDIENIILMSCSKNPDFRFENCDGFLTALENINKIFTPQTPVNIPQQAGFDGRTREYINPPIQETIRQPQKKNYFVSLIIVLIIVAMGAIAGLIYYLTRPETPETKIEKVTTKNPPTSEPIQTPPQNTPPQNVQTETKYTDDEQFVKSFIEALGSRDFSNAYSKTKNPAWGSYSHFISTDGFGGIISTKVYEVKSNFNNGFNAKVYVDYESIDPVNDAKRPERGSAPRYRLYLHLQKYNNEWKITKSSKNP